MCSPELGIRKALLRIDRIGPFGRHLMSAEVLAHDSASSTSLIATEITNLALATGLELEDPLDQVFHPISVLQLYHGSLFIPRSGKPDPREELGDSRRSQLSVSFPPGTGQSKATSFWR